MDWYFRRDGEDLIVPNDEETSDLLHADDRSPYPNGWLQWEVGRTENSLPPNKFLSRSLKPLGTGLNSNWQSLHENFDLEYSIPLGEDSSNQGADGDFFLVESSPRTLHSSFHDEKMDDFWESAFTEDPSAINGLSSSHDFAYTSMSFGNLLTDMLVDPPDSLKDPSFMGSVCPKTTFSPLTDDVAEDEDQLEDVSPSPVTDNSRSPDGSPTASVLSVLVPAEQTTSEIVGHVHEQKYLESTVLQELEDVMAQLNAETRICFRDALYRLAKISKQRHSFVEDKPPSQVLGESSRHGKPKLAEAKTNAIDRTVASLMFNKANSGPPGLPCPRSVHQCVESCPNSGSYDNISHESAIHPYHYQPASPPYGIKVPPCRKENGNCSHSSCILSYLMPEGGADYVSDMRSHQAGDSAAIVGQFDPAEDLAAIVDQFGANQQSECEFTMALPHRQYR